MERVVEAKGKSHDQLRRSNFDLFARAEQVARREGAENRRLGQCSPFDLDHGHVDFSRSVEALAPEALSVSIQGNRQAGPVRAAHVKNGTSETSRR